MASPGVQPPPAQPSGGPLEGAFLPSRVPASRRGFHRRETFRKLVPAAGARRPSRTAAPARPEAGPCGGVGDARMRPSLPPAGADRSEPSSPCPARTAAVPPRAVRASPGVVLSSASDCARKAADAKLLSVRPACGDSDGCALGTCSGRRKYSVDYASKVQGRGKGQLVCDEFISNTK